MSKLYNIDFLKDLMAGNELETNNLLQLFIDLTPPLMENMMEAAKRKDWIEAGNLAHKLKSSVRLMGINSIVDDTLFIEINGKAQTEINLLPSKIEELSIKISKIVDEMKNDISKK
ncbi:MAG: hypothetical protein AUJ98_06380 [Bacteroidetes bacterium CG2_30_33_31]|nr:MAG: hypothetical protein AUJ98_06380 [Bacteroidetes bacterium CG2_30_33_31]